MAWERGLASVWMTAAAYAVSVLCPEPELAAGASLEWGRLANPGFEHQRIKTTLFFSGQARDATNPYGCPSAPPENLSLYTVHPLDSRHLEWSEDRANREFALDQMVEAGINVVSMSTWGEGFLPCDESWAVPAPMQTAPASHDELFAAAVGKPLLIMPFIESRHNWNVRNEFPRWTDGRVAPGTVSQIIHLVNRYLRDGRHPEWADQWARVYDSIGEPRHAVVLIHASSNRLVPSDHQAFAAGFDLVAEEVFLTTGVKVGFLIDALPPDTFAPGVFRPSPETSGPFLRDRLSLLGIQCFIPEIWMMGSPEEAERIAWKRGFSARWRATGIPFLMDVSPGYDAHLVFPGSVTYGHSAAWLRALRGMAEDLGDGGIVFNSWNGYTEGMAAVPLRDEDGGDTYFQWLRSMDRRFLRGDCDGDGRLQGVTDAVRNLRYCFSGVEVSCVAACDADGDGNACSGVSDGLRILMVLFRGGGPLPPPFPDCGISTRPEDRKLGCESTRCR